MDQAFRLRKRVFHDQLGWAVTIDGDCERDEYDALRPAYLMWSNDRADRLYGTLRLMPTTGPTLLYDVFRDTFAGASLIAPGIYEGTRMCLDEEILSEDFPNLETGKAFGMLLLALCECGLSHGIETLVSNYEPHLARVYRRAGLGWPRRRLWSLPGLLRCFRSFRGGSHAHAAGARSRGSPLCRISAAQKGGQRDRAHIGLIQELSKGRLRQRVPQPP